MLPRMSPRMSLRRHVFQRFMGTRRRRQMAGISLAVALIAVVLPLVLPPSATRAARLTAAALGPLTAGCSSPSDCVAKMTLPEEEGQMTQVEKNAFTQAGNSLTDITTYFIGSVLSGGGGGPNGARGTATQWGGMVDNFQSYSLQNPLGIPLIYSAYPVHRHNKDY